ncbi:MAG: hypothetical protein JRI95_06515 [Deltaproteobacteria bacterium]|nr:hypothetical protein [Deltaproteobacteria bacterium]
MRRVKRENTRVFHFLGLAAIIALGLFVIAAPCIAADDDCKGAVVVEPDWERSYKAGYTDSNGHFNQRIQA